MDGVQEVQVKLDVPALAIKFAKISDLDKVVKVVGHPSMG